MSQLPPFRRRCSLLSAGLVLLLVSAVTVSAQGPEQPEDNLKRVYVPVQDFNSLIAGSRQGVFLPREEFETLYTEAKKAHEQQRNQPRGVVVKSVNYVARIEERQLVITATAELEQFHSGWQVLALPLENLAVEQATLNDGPAQLGVNNSVYLLTREVGKHTLTLELSTPLVSQGSDQVAAFGLLPKTTATLELTLPASKHLRVDGLILERPAEIDQPATYQVPVGGRENLRLRITDQQEQTATDSLVFATTLMGLYASQGEVTWQAAVNVQVFGTALNQFEFLVPRSLEITDVTSAGLESWELSDSEDGKETSIKLAFRQALTGMRKIQFRGVMTTEVDQAWLVPTLRMQGVTSHVGSIVAAYPRELRLRLDRQQGVRQVLEPSSDAPREQLEFLSNRSSVTFDFWQQDFQLSFATETRRREVLANNLLTRLQVTQQGLELDTAATIECLYAPLFELQVELPAEWFLTDLRLRGQTVTWRTLKDEPGVHQLRIPISPPLKPGEQLKFLLFARRTLEDPLENETASVVTLDPVRFPQAKVYQGTYAVVSSNDFEVTPQNVSRLDAVYLGLTGEQAGFQFQDDEFSAEIAVTRKPGRLAATALTFARLDPETLAMHWEAELQVEGGGLRTITVELPEEVPADLRFELRPLAQPVQTTGFSRQAAPASVQIVEQQAGEVKNGRRSWQLRFDQYLKGRAVLWASDQQNRTADELALSGMSFPQAEREDSYLAIEASGEQRLSVAPRNANQQLQEIDPVDLPPSLAGYQPEERIVAVYHSVISKVDVQVSEQRYDRVAVPTAVCSELELLSNLGQTGEFQHRASAEFVAVGVQSLRVQLPEGSTLWASLINGAPLEVRRKGNAYLLQLPPVEPPDATRTLELFYQTRQDRLTSFGTIRETPPQFSVTSGQGEQQPLEILQRTWTVYYPDDTLLVTSEGPFQPVNDLDRASLLGKLLQGFAGTSADQLLQKTLAIVVISALIFLLTMTGRKFGKLGLFSLGGVSLVCLLGYAVFVPAVQQAREAASKSWDGASGYYAENSSVETTSEPGMGSEAAEYDDEYANLDEAGATQHSPDSVEQSIKPPDFAREGNEAMPQEPAAGSDGPFPPQNAPTDPFAPPPVPKPQAPGFAPGTTPEEVPESQPTEGQPTEGGQQQQGQPGGRNPFAGDDLQIAQGKPQQPQEEAEQGGGPGVRQPPAVTAPEQGGRLSVTVNFEEPVDQPQQEFQYFGTGTDKAGTPLEIRYENQTASWVLRAVLIFGLLVVSFFLRQRPMQFRAILVTLGIAIPLALLPITPLSWHVVLDGLFLGMCAGGLLWLVMGILKWFKAELNAWFGVTASLLFALTFANAFSPNVFADEPVPGRSPSIMPVESPLPDVVVIPYDAGEDPLSARRVFLSREKFLELWKLAHPDKQPAENAPVDGLVTGAIYSARLSADKPPRIDVSARIVLHSFREHQIKLPLPFGDVAVSSAKLDGKPAALISRKEVIEYPNAPAQQQEVQQQPNAEEPGFLSGWQVLVSEPGAHVLDVELTLPAKATAQTGEFTLPLLPVPSARLSFELPNGDNEVGELNVGVSQSSGAYRRTTEGDTERVDIPVNHGGDVKVTWRPKQVQNVDGSIAQAATRQLLWLSDLGLNLHTDHQIRVLQGKLSELVYALPEEMKVRRIRGADVGGWKLEGEDQQRLLRVFLRRPIDSTTQVALELYQTLDIDDQQTELPFPKVTLQNVRREEILLGVTAADQFLVRSGNLAGVTQLNANSFTLAPNSVGIKSAVQLAYRVNTNSATVPLQISRKAAETTADTLVRVIVDRRKINLAAVITVELKGTPRSRLTVQLPFNFLLLDASADYLADWYVHTEDDISYLVLELDQPRRGTIRINMKGNIPKEPADDFLELELPQLLEVERMSAQAGLWFDQSYRGGVEDAEGWNSINPQKLPDTVRFYQNRLADFAFSTETEDLLGFLLFNISEATPRLTADAVTLTTVTDTFMTHWFGLRWSIQQAAADTFVFSTPAEFAGKLTFPDQTFRQVTHSAPKEGNIFWTVVLRNPKQKELFVLATATLPPPKDRQVAGPPVSFIVPGSYDETDLESVPQPLDLQRQYAVLINQSRNQLTLNQSKEFEAISVQNLPFRVRQELLDQATDILRLKNNQIPTWNLQSFVEQKQAPATIKSAHITSVITQDGSWRAQARYEIRNRARQFLAVKMPDETRILSVFVQEKPSRPVQTVRKNEPISLIALPKTSAADTPFAVDIIFTGKLSAPLPEGFTITGEELQLPAPHVISLQEDPELGIPVTHTTWTVYLPEDFNVQLVDDPEKTNFTRSTSVDQSIARQKSLYSTAEELMQVIEGPASGRAKYQAWNNLKALNYEIQEEQRERSYSPSGSYRSKGSADRYYELGEKQRQLEQRLYEQERKLQINDRDQTIILNDNSHSLQQLDAEQQQQELSRQFKGFLFDNGGVMSGEGRGEGTEDFGIEQSPLKPATQLPTGNTGKGGGKPGEGKPASPSVENFNNGNFQRRQRQTKGDIEQLDKLLENEKNFNGNPQSPNPGGFNQTEFPAPAVDPGFANQPPGRPGNEGNLPDTLDANDNFEAGGEAVGDQLAGKQMTWTQTGGLSLKIDLPTNGQKFVFTKISGDPKLALSVWPRQSVKSGFGFAWALTWLVIAVSLVLVLARSGAIHKHLPKAALAVGLVAFFLFPAPVSWLGLLLFLLGGIFCGIGFARAETNTGNPAEAES